MKSKSSNVLFAILALSAGLLVSLFPASSWSAQLETAHRAQPELEAITMMGDETAALPAFELTDHRNQVFNNSRLKDKWSLMFFGYTSCPDVCPTTLNNISHVVHALKDPTVLDAVKVYFVSVDPQRDKPEILASYMNYFNPDFTAVTGDSQMLDVLTSALGVAYKIKKKAETDPVYSVDHSGFVVLINPQGENAGLFFSDPDNVQAVARDLVRLVKGSH